VLQYHDREWGVPVHDDRKHFEFLVLEGAQAGLSWAIVLRKREGYRRAFDEFDPEKIARFSARRIETLALDSAIIRNRMKDELVITEGLPESSNKLATENATEHVDGKQEPIV
jgi:DNA-3-methyladenine glycosylase I